MHQVVSQFNKETSRLLWERKAIAFVHRLLCETRPSDTREVVLPALPRELDTLRNQLAIELKGLV